jgi:hypothetical protein
MFQSVLAEVMACVAQGQHTTMGKRCKHSIFSH